MASVRRLLRAAWTMEIAMYRSLWRWARRRPAVPDGEQPFRYDAVVNPVIWLFIFLSAVEIPVFHLLLPWAWARTVSLVVGAWGLVWMLGLLASNKMFPHTVGPAGIRIRNGATSEALLPWTLLESVRTGRRDVKNSLKAAVEATEHGCRVDVGVFGQTDVHLVLREPTLLPALADTDGVPVTVVGLHADDHRALAAAVREHLDARSTFGA